MNNNVNNNVQNKIENKFLIYDSYAAFEDDLNKNRIKQESIVFIK